MRKRDNRKYFINSRNIPMRMMVRDVVITLLAWALWSWICWDMFQIIYLEILHYLDDDPVNNLDLARLVRQLQVSYLFSGSVIAFLIVWAMINLARLAKTKNMAWAETAPLDLEREVVVYGCTVKEVVSWREARVLEVGVDDSGKVESVEYMP